MLLFLMGCTPDMTALYEKEKSAALADPGAAPRGWEPELRLRLGEGALDRIGEGAIASGLLNFKKTFTLNGPLGITVKVKPSAKVKTLSLKTSSECDGCLDLDASLTGTAKWEAGRLDGSVPFTATIDGTVAFTIDKASGGWDLAAKVIDVDSVRVGNTTLGEVSAGDALQGWVEDALKSVPEMSLGKIGGDALPLRAMRLGRDGDSLELQGLTDVAGGATVASAGGRPRGDWDLRVSPETALALMRRAAFQKGKLDMDIALDPRGLKVDGTRFDLDLRIWRLNSPGWWREYVVDGEMDVQRGKLSLKSKGASEGDKSPGAGLADPLALLGEGLILESVAEGLDEAVPAHTSATLEGLKVTVRTTDARGHQGALALSGSLDIDSGAKSKRSSGTSSGKGKSKSKSKSRRR